VITIHKLLDLLSAVGSAAGIASLVLYLRDQARTRKGRKIK